MTPDPKRPTPPMTEAELYRWMQPAGSNDVFEDIAEWFHAETGHLRPGKDKPWGFHMTEEGEPDCCRDAWLEWTSIKRDAAYLKLWAAYQNNPIPSIRLAGEPRPRGAGGGLGKGPADAGGTMVPRRVPVPSHPRSPRPGLAEGR